MTVTIQSDSITLRPYEISDASDVYSAVNESVAEMSPWMPWCHSGYSVHDAINWIMEQETRRDRGQGYEFAIIGSGGQYFGGCGVNQISKEYRLANLGYWVRTSATGRGIATRAVELLSRWVFKNTQLIRLEIVIANSNSASLRVAEKAGAWPEGMQRSRLLLHDRVHDAMMYSIVRNDVRRNRD